MNGVVFQHSHAFNIIASADFLEVSTQHACSCTRANIWSGFQNVLVHAPLQLHPVGRVSADKDKQRHTFGMHRRLSEVDNILR